jgi:hypothetical protein
VETRALYSQETNNKWNTDRFKDVETRALYSQQQSDNGNSSLNRKFERIEAAVTTDANKIIGNNTNKRQNEWFDEECKEVIKKKIMTDKKIFKETYERTGGNIPR